ncbi:MAG TPA: hydratase, partial [Candidatus Gemmiger faecigallinarum]|nr:hydratase [Candidatus Gemmiger faecigallinarum]
TTCWSSIWQTDEVTKEYFEIHGRPEAYKPLAPADVAYYDGCIELDLSTVECMIALPMHPSYAYPIRELKANAKDILHEIETRANQQLNGKVQMDLVGKVAADGSIRVDQGIVAGCSGGTFENVCAVAQILKGKNCGAGTFRISVYPDSMPTYLELVKNGAVADIVSAGGIFRECFCGPCFGAGDTPANGEFSIRHTTRNFPNREGSKPGEGQISAVALMDARSIAATAANGGVLTAASEVLDQPLETPPCRFDAGIYEKRVYNGWGKAEPDYALKFGPNIKDWPEQPALTDDLLLKVASYITDPVTTTDELIPSGETSSYRSNPLRLAEFTLSRKDPAYVGRAKAVKAMDEARKAGSLPAEVQAVYDALAKAGVQADGAAANIGSAVFAVKPGDGSAREQAASCQRVLGGAANFACEYATKRYRSNCINWGMLPFLVEDPDALALDSYVFVPGVRRALLEAADAMTGYVVGADGSVTPVTLRLGALTDDERQILADGCLINYYKNH